MAHQALNQRTADEIVCRQLDAACDRKDSAFEALIVFVEGLDVLTVSRRQLADGGDSEAEQIGLSMAGVALKIALQTAFALRSRELIVGAREVIHADVQVAGCGQLPHCER